MNSRVAVVTGVAGQDGYFLARRLLEDGWKVHGVARRTSLADVTRLSAEGAERFTHHEIDVLEPGEMAALLRETRPEEIYNLAGHSSVSASFANPVEAWRTNAEAVLTLLEAVRIETPTSKVYQASSGEMFGAGPGAEVLHNEDSAFLPQSPYAVAKAAAHVLCGAYRRIYGLRVACGILFNHVSHRRTEAFLTRKVVDHVISLRAKSVATGKAPPLLVGNLRAQRDWGYAPDYVDGMVCVLRQVAMRAAQPGNSADPDVATSYRDYVLATGRVHAVWELIDRAFTLGGLDLVWDRSSPDVDDWHARFRAEGSLAVVVDKRLLRPADPISIAADPSRAMQDLGWSPQQGLDVFLADMIRRA